MKNLILSLICLIALSTMAQTKNINAVKFVQEQTTDWYLLSSNPEVTFDANHNPVISGKTYDLALGAVETTFGTAPEDIWNTVRTDGVVGNWNTICMPNNITAIDGATFWNIVGQDDSQFVLDQITEPQAGQGYIIRFTKSELKVKYGNLTATEPVEATSGNPIQGTYNQIDPEEDGTSVLTNNYIVYNNELRLVGTWVGLLDHRAYVVKDYIPGDVPAPAPGRTRAFMPKQTPTGEWRMENGEMRRTGKFLRKGQLIIVKDNKMYNAQGAKIGESVN